MARYGIFHWGEERAYAFIDKFIEDLDILTQNPAMGKKDGDDRNISFGNYRVIYQIGDGFIYIIGIEPKGRPSI